MGTKKTSSTPSDFTFVELRWAARMHPDGECWIELVMTPADPSIETRPVLIALPLFVVQRGGSPMLDTMIRLIASSIGAVGCAPANQVQ
jgi:hypothetical protein